MNGPPRRDLGLALRVLLTVVLAAVVTPVVVVLTRPVVHGWAETIGFIAGVLAACAGIRAVLARLASTTGAA